MRTSLLGPPVAVVAGLCAGVVGTLAHSVALPLPPLVDVPVGLVLALALTAVVQAGLVAAWPFRPAAVGGVLGWGTAAFAGLATGPGGDVLLARPLGAAGAGWLLGGPVVLVLATVAVRRLLTAAPRPVPAA